MDSRTGIYCLQRYPTRTAGDVTGVIVVPRRVTVKIGDAENRWRGCRETNRLNKALTIFLSAESGGLIICVYVCGGGGGGRGGGS